MNFKKENLKEVTTTDKITDVVIFEKGSSEPKRIKNSVYNESLNNLQDSTPLIYAALLTQESTNAPTDSIEFSNFETPVVWNYVSTGLYRTDSISLTGLVVTGASKGGIIHFYRGGARIFVESRDYTGTLSDDILNGVSIKIEKFN